MPRKKQSGQPGYVKKGEMHSIRVRTIAVCVFTVVMSAQLTPNLLADEYTAVVQSSTATGRTPTVSLQREMLIGEPIDSGYVFLDGQLIPRPYRIAQKGCKVYVNEKPFAEFGDERDIDGRVLPDQTRIDQNRFIATLERRLTWDETLVAFDEHTVVMIDSVSAASFLQSLGECKTLQERVQCALAMELDSNEVPTNLIPTFQWRIALDRFELTESQKLFVQELGMFEESDEDAAWDPSNERVETQRVDFSDRMYVFNVAGMLLVAISAGTVLGHRPSTNVRWSRIVDCRKANRLAINCLALIVLLSVFDLTSTLIAETIGGFEELNPFTESLVDSPVVLTAFKLAATLLGVSLLWSCRRYAGAQMASWWLCLILTMVVARWVVIQSLFYV